MTNSITKMKMMLLALFFTSIASQEESISPYKEIQKFVKTFKLRGMNASTYYLLSIDEKHNNLVVGARNNAFLVNLDDMESYKSWNVLQQSSSGAFVKLVLPFRDRILLCWVEKLSTGSCTWRNRTTLGEAKESNQGYVFKSRELYNAPSSSPDQNDTAIITEDGTLFVGTFVPVQGCSIIYSKRFKQPQLTEVYSATEGSFRSFYEDVHFVKSFEIGPYVYFFFRERSLECDSCGKVKTSRVARLCKGDRGGYLRLLNTFVTFQKAKLMCSDGMKYALNFNEIQDVWWDNRTGRFYAAFSSQPNGPAISAICIYSLSSINRILNESYFKSFKSETKGWSEKRNKIGEYFPACKVNPKYLRRSSSVVDGVMATKDMLSSAYGDLMHGPLMADIVEPVGSKAWFIRNGIRITGISLDVVGQNIVVYASTDRGSVMKISQPRGISHPCLYSEMEVYPSNNKEVIKTMVIDQVRHVLYLGTRYSLTQLNLDQCERYQHDKSACISAADPYCGWDDKTLRCSSVLSHGETPQQNLTICPKGRKETSWSSWRTCVQSDGNLCRCQTLRCQEKGNTPCLTDVEVRLENCTVDLTGGWEGKHSWEMLGVQHGNWSVWGNWSECSTETWAGVRSRSRTCTNPPPRRGGRTCVGDSMQYEPCSLEVQEEERNIWTSPAMPLNSNTNKAVKFKLTARAKGYKLTDLDLELSNETIDCGKDPGQCGKGKWESWGNWSVCSVEGFQMRRRNCSKEPCLGERLQERRCPPTNERCEGVIDNSWDAWSSCACDHALELTKGTGVMYRIRKCCRTCPKEPSCVSSVEFKMCFCQNSTSVLGRQQGSHPSDNVSNSRVIIGSTVGSVIVVVCCVAAIFYMNHKKKYNVSKTEENNSHDAGSESKFSTLPSGTDESLRQPLSPSSSHGKRDKSRSRKIKFPMKNFFPKRMRKAPSLPVECV